jgi:hypothetical protein
MRAKLAEKRRNMVGGQWAVGWAVGGQLAVGGWRLAVGSWQSLNRPEKRLQDLIGVRSQRLRCRYKKATYVPRRCTEHLVGYSHVQG